jgi:CRISPR system Cascade subunit CasD
MSQYLVFQLHGPMASWGVDAPGEVRHSHELPSRSALLGLLAAALGIRRDEEERLNAFNQHYSFLLCASKNRAGRGIITRFRCRKKCVKPVISAAAKS